MQSQNLIRFKQSNQSKIDNVSLNALLSKIPESCIWCVTASCLDSIILKIFKSFLFLNFQTWNFKWLIRKWQYHPIFSSKTWKCIFVLVGIRNEIDGCHAIRDFLQVHWHHHLSSFFKHVLVFSAIYIVGLTIDVLNVR